MLLSTHRSSLCSVYLITRRTNSSLLSAPYHAQDINYAEVQNKGPGFVVWEELEDDSAQNVDKSYYYATPSETFIFSFSYIILLNSTRC
jgi:hypothetical protein